jgi:hypothetical protein
MFTQGFVEEGAKFIALFWPAIVNPKEWIVNEQAIFFNWVSVP